MQCPKVQDFWKQVLNCVKETADADLESSPRLYVLGDPFVVGQPDFT